MHLMDAFVDLSDLSLGSNADTNVVWAQLVCSGFLCLCVLVVHEVLHVEHFDKNFKAMLLCILAA